MNIINKKIKIIITKLTRCGQQENDDPIEETS